MPETADPATHGAGDSRLWAVTSYYNPAGYRRRLANYRVFRAELSVPLLTVEWSPAGEFQLGPGDADVLLQVAGGDVMWQKERLLNLGIARLPPRCDHVAWLDCDVVFERGDWADRAIAALGDARLVQLYDHVVHLSPVPIDELSVPGAWRAGRPERRRIGAGRLYRDAIASGDRESLTRPPPGQPTLPPATCGYGWAARRELLEGHPLLDVWIVGGGDLASYYAAIGLPDFHVRTRSLTPAHVEHYLERAERLAAALEGRISHLPGDVTHLWHGDLKDRHYSERYRILERHAFDPRRHLEADDNGLWRWTAAAADLARDVRAYFGSRFEDGRPADVEAGEVPGEGTGQAADGAPGEARG